jgi:hypothetical protein
MEFHVAGADIPELWHAVLELPERLSWRNEMIGEVQRDKLLLLRQRKGRPILCLPEELRAGDTVVLRVPGYAPLSVTWTGGDCVAVTLVRS